MRPGGEVATFRQYLHAGLLDEIHLAVGPVLPGSGERLLGDPRPALDDWQCREFTPAASVARVRLRP